MKRLLKSTFKTVAPALAAAALLSSTSYAGTATRYHHQTITIAPKQECHRVLWWWNCNSGMAMQSTHGMTTHSASKAEKEGGRSQSHNSGHSNRSGHSKSASAGSALMSMACDASCRYDDAVEFGATLPPGMPEEISCA